MVLIYICLFILGSFIGSFLGVVGLRVGRKEGFVIGRSHCDHCLTPLHFYDMIPIFSYLHLKGKCRYCKKKISPVLFLSEVGTGILFMVSFYSFSFSYSFLLSILLASLFIIVLVSDFTYLIIDDKVLLFFAISFFFVQILRLGMKGALYHVASGVALFLFMYGLLCLGNVLFHKESLGGGDVKLLFVIGLVLDPFLGILSIFLASFMALPVSIFLYYKNKERMIPFGPFLLLGCFILFFMKVTSNDILSYFMLF